MEEQNPRSMGLVAEENDYAALFAADALRRPVSKSRAIPFCPLDVVRTGRLLQNVAAVDLSVFGVSSLGIPPLTRNPTFDAHASTARSVPVWPPETIVAIFALIINSF